MIPEKAKKVFSGVIFDVYQWEQEMYDGSVEIFEKLDRPDTVEIIMTTPEGKLLIQRQQQPDHDEWFLCVSGGRMDKGEKPIESAKREMLEETGCTSDDWELLDTYCGSSKINWDLYVYVARNCKRILEQELDVGERIELMEVTFDEFIQMVDSKQINRIAESIREWCIRASYDKTKYNELKQKIYGG